MATTKSDDGPNDEWSLMAHSYQDVLLPRLQPLYDILASCVVREIESSHTTHKYEVLDYGTGPGEPILTILKLLEANKISNVDLRGTDSSSGMLLLAEERLRNVNGQHLTVQFASHDGLLNSNLYDIITASLVLPYSSDKAGMLRELFMQLKPKGLLITSHWPHSSQVPVLSVLKRVNHFMATGERIDISHIELDVSFSCWQEEVTKQMLMAEGFTIDHWISVHLPMSFPDIRTLLSFCRIAPWFNNDDLYSEAEKETRRILLEDYKLKFDLDSRFELPSTAIVIVASK